MTSNTSTTNGRLGIMVAGLAMLFAGAAFVTPAPAQAADGYYPMVCRGPLPAMNATNGVLRMRARPGRRANAPRPGECVWLDRGVNRRGEVGPDGFIRIRLPARGLRVEVLNAGGRIREVVYGDTLAISFWRTNGIGRTFIFEARRVGNRGGYVARRLRTPVRARPAPRARELPRATPAPSGRHRPAVTAESAPPPPPHPGVRVRPAP